MPFSIDSSWRPKNGRSHLFEPVPFINSLSLGLHAIIMRERGDGKMKQLQALFVECCWASRVDKQRILEQGRKIHVPQKTVRKMLFLALRGENDNMFVNCEIEELRWMDKEKGSIQMNQDPFFYGSTLLMNQ